MNKPTHPQADKARQLAANVSEDASIMQPQHLLLQRITQLATELRFTADELDHQYRNGHFFISKPRFLKHLGL